MNMETILLCMLTATVLLGLFQIGRGLWFILSFTFVGPSHNKRELDLLDRRDAQLDREGWFRIEDCLPPDGATLDLLKAEDGLKIYQVSGMTSGNEQSWDILDRTNHFTHWRINEMMP